MLSLSDETRVGLQERAGLLGLSDAELVSVLIETIDRDDLSQTGAGDQIRATRGGLRRGPDAPNRLSPLDGPRCNRACRKRERPAPSRRGQALGALTARWDRGGLQKLRDTPQPSGGNN